MKTGQESSRPKEAEKQHEDEESGQGDPKPSQEDQWLQEADRQIHPTRHLMLKDEEKAQAGVASSGTAAESDGMRRRTRRPGYYDQQLKKAEQRRQEALERREEALKRKEERERKLAERSRHRRAVAKTMGRDGQKKLGRESSLLLDKVRRMVAEES